MSEWPAALDPDVRQLLLDVASGERSLLFKNPPQAIALGAIDDLPSASAGTAGWSPAERHLLEWRREEVADILLRAFRATLQQDPYGRTLFIFGSSPAAPPGDTERTRERARVLAERFPATADAPALGLLTGLAERGAAQLDASLVDLAQAALRLVPRETSRILEAAAFVVSREERKALDILHAAARLAPSPKQESLAWSNIGLALSVTDQQSGALTAYARAANARPDAPVPIASALIQALLVGDERSALLCAPRVDEILVPESELVRFLIDAHRERLAAGQMSIPPECRALFRSLESKLGPVSWSIAHALLS